MIFNIFKLYLPKRGNSPIRKNKFSINTPKLSSDYINELRLLKEWWYIQILKEEIKELYQLYNEGIKNGNLKNI